MPQLDRRLAEAARLGFARAVVPAGARATGPGAVLREGGMELLPVSDVRQALEVALFAAG